MKKLIHIFLAASLLLTGCQGQNGESGKNDTSAEITATTSVAVTTEATTDNVSDITEAITSKVSATTKSTDKQVYNAKSETTNITSETKGNEEMKETYTSAEAEIIEFGEEDVITTSSGSNLNSDNGIDLPIIPIN